MTLGALPAQEPPRRGSVAGVMVLFHPDDAASANIAAAANQLDVLYVIDNTPSPGSDMGLELAHTEGIEVLHRGGNLGLGAAYNLACSRALSLGHEWILLLDQDSSLHPAFSTTMNRRLRSYAASSDRPVGVAGPGFTYASDPTRVSVASAEVSEVVTVVSSGSLTWLPGWRMVGGFQEGFFIDYVDIDYCLRIRSAGLAVVALGDVLMTHGIGNSRRNVFLGYSRVTSNYPAFRHYYIARNFVLTARGALGRQERAWVLTEFRQRLKFTVLSLVMESGRWSILRATAAGLIAGLRGGQGPRD